MASRVNTDKKEFPQKVVTYDFGGSLPYHVQKQISEKEMTPNKKKLNELHMKVN